MKYILVVLLLSSCIFKKKGVQEGNAVGYNPKAWPKGEGWAIGSVGTLDKSHTFSVGSMQPSHSIQFNSNDAKYFFYLDFKNDTLVYGGTMQPRPAAKLFVYHLGKYLTYKIDSLEKEVAALQFQLAQQKK